MPAHSTPKLRLSSHREDGRTPSPWREARAASRRGPSRDRVAAPFFAGDWRAILLSGLRAGDLGVIAASGFASYWLRWSSELPTLYWWQILAGCLIAANGFHFAQLYDLASLRQRGRHLARIAAVWALSSLAIAAIVFFAGMATAVSRGWLLLWAITGLAGLFGARLLYWTWLARWSEGGKLVANVAIVGPEGAAARLARRVEASGGSDVRLLGVFRSASAPGSTDDEGVDALLRLARRERLDEVLVALRCADTEDIGGTLAALATLPVDVKLCLDLDDATRLSRPPTAMPTLLLCRRPLAGGRIVVKRAMDMATSAALLLLFGPLMLAIAALVKLDSPGPAIFRQRRYGFNKQPITVYKFRTMYCDGADDQTVPQARRNDPRVTRLGRFLRRSSLDELPQLFNVLSGGMSLVGPRPHAMVHDEKYAALVDGYLARHRMQPGITGWAQINGFRGETDTLEKMVRRIEHDLFYIEHWSPLLDLRILFLTLRCGFHDRNAY